MAFLESEYYIKRTQNQNKKFYFALSFFMSRKYSAKGDYGREEK